MISLKESLISQIKKHPSETTSNARDLLDDPTSGGSKLLLDNLHFELIGNHDFDDIFSYDKRKKILTVDNVGWLGTVRGFNPTMLKNINIDKIVYLKPNRADVRIFISEPINYPKDLKMEVKHPKYMVRFIIDRTLYNNQGYKNIKFEGPYFYDKMCITSADEYFREDSINTPFLDWVQDLYLNKKIYFGNGVYFSFGRLMIPGLKYLEEFFDNISKYLETNDIGYLPGIDVPKWIMGSMRKNFPYNIEGEYIIIKIDGSLKGSKQKDIDFWTNEVFLKSKRWKKYDTYIDNEYLVIY